MSLGESIYRLRTARGMSQGGLANALDVSRQSVSKWENNMAVPELDKLMKMSELFGVSLDELVRGENAAKSDTVPEQPKTAEAAAPFPPRKIVGTVLFCMGFLMFLLFSLLGWWTEGLILASPFLMCGCICFLFRRHAGLWCAWALYFAADVYLRITTGVSRGFLRSAFVWSKGWSMTLLISLVLTLVLLVLIAVTVIRFRRMPYPGTRAAGVRLLCGWVALLMLILLPLLINTAGFGWLSLYAVLFFLLEWLRIGLFTILLIFSLAALRDRAAHHTGKM